MIWKIAKKDFLLNLMTFKFAVGTILCVVLMAIFMPVLVADYQNRLEHYDKEVASNEAELRKVKVYKNITPTVYRPPAVLSVFSQGLEKNLGSSAKIELDKVPEISAAAAEGNAYLSVFPVFGASLILEIVIGVLALLAAYDVISGERERGTLKLMLSGTVARYHVLLGKLLAGLMTLVVPVTIAFMLGLAILLSFPMVDLAGSDWARIGLMYVASLVFIAAMYNLGLLFSCLTGRSGISLVFGLFLWVIFVVVIPNGSIYLATQIQPLESEERKDGQIASLRDQLHNKLRQLELPDGGAQSDDDGAFGHWYHRLCDRPCLERYQKQYAFGVPLAIEYADKFWEVEHSYLSSLCGQRGLARTLSRISPIALYENAMSTLADTDISSFQYFVDHVRIYRTRVIEYIRSRTDNFSSSSLFTPCTEEEMMEYGKLISRAYHVENDDRDKAWQDLKKWFEDKVSEPPSLDLQDFPQFTYHRAAILSFRRAIADLTLLLVINVVFFALAFVVFLRYDVRSD